MENSCRSCVCHDDDGTPPAAASPPPLLLLLLLLLPVGLMGLADEEAAREGAEDAGDGPLVAAAPVAALDAAAVDACRASTLDDAAAAVAWGLREHDSPDARSKAPDRDAGAPDAAAPAAAAQQRSSGAAACATSMMMLVRASTPLRGAG